MRARTGSLTIGLLAALSACGLDTPPPTPIAPPLDRVVKVDRAATPDGVIAYITQRGNPAHGGSVEDSVSVRDRGDMADLVGAPEAFKAFLETQLAERGADVDKYLASRQRTMAIEGCEWKVEIRVWGIAEQVATGRERACGLESNDVIWANTDGTWRRASRMQGGWNCSELNRYRVPADITGAVCWYDGWKTRPYDGPRS